jgi:predicted metal-binding protein
VGVGAAGDLPRARASFGPERAAEPNATEEVEPIVQKVMVVGCGAYMDSGYGCPGEWRCLKAASFGDGKFSETSQVIAFAKCECPGRSAAPNLGMAIKLSEVKPDVIHLAKCLVEAKPGCPYMEPEELAKILEDKTGVPVVQGTHDYL